MLDIQGDIKSGPRVLPVPFVARNSDQILWRRCRRKWLFQSHNGLYLEPIEDPIPALWFGTGWHFALEDYHGYNRFGHPLEAYKAYQRCFRRSQAPENHEDLLELATGMFDYYVNAFLPRHNEFQTYVVNGEPQVEVEFNVPIEGIDPAVAFFGGTIDRIVTDPYGRLYCLDYKTAAKIDSDKLDTDPQITTYLWAARQLYGPNVEGFIYLQFLKKLQEPPKRLRSGGFSINRQTPCTAYLFRKTLVEEYGFIPTEYLDFLNFLISQEGPEGDMFVRRTLVRRNDAQIYNEGVKIGEQVREMIAPERSYFPNPTNMCASECKFKQPCIAMDAEEDYTGLLNSSFRQRHVLHSWRANLVYPKVEEETAEEENG
jgi:hypothetical protein